MLKVIGNILQRMTLCMAQIWRIPLGEKKIA